MSNIPGELVKRMGKFADEFDVTCGRCSKTLQMFTSSSRAAEDIARMHGWKHLEKAGWICWSCIDEEDNDVSKDQD
jgi:hypothetical protein